MAPEFRAMASDGSEAALAEHRNVHPVVLIFYPGDYTPVCTAQLCSVRDRWEQFHGLGAVVYGVNPVNARIHAGFAARNHLPFPLIHDKGGRISAAYGCRMLFGIVNRTVYVIDRQGRIAFAERGVPSTERILGVLHELALKPDEQPAHASADQR